MGFSLDTVEDFDLEFDLTRCGGPKGTVPEPMTPVIERWVTEINQVAVEGGLVIPPNATQTDIAALVSARSEAMPELNRRSLAAYARLCGAQEVPSKSRAKDAPKTAWEGGCPTYQELEALPHRARNLFFGWLAGKFNNPESAPGATTG